MGIKSMGFVSWRLDNCVIYTTMKLRHLTTEVQFYHLWLIVKCLELCYTLI